MTAEAPLTRKDVEEIVARVVGDLLTDVMQLFNERFRQLEVRQREFEAYVMKRFDVIDKRFDALDKRFDKLEDKLENTQAKVDHHSIDIRQLKRKIA